MTNAIPIVATEALPIVDICALRDGTDPQRVANELLSAITDLGFLYVTNHGINETILTQARRSGLLFFQLPESEKQAASINTHHHGYLGLGSTRMHDTAKVDLKESFNWGLEPTPETFEYETLNPLIGPNRWPQTLPSLATSIRPFFDAASACAEDLLRGFAIGAGLTPEYFIAARDRPLSRGSLQYYPPQPQDAVGRQFGVSAHTDFGMLTLLCQDSVMVDFVQHHTE